MIYQNSTFIGVLAYYFYLLESSMWECSDIYNKYDKNSNKLQIQNYNHKHIKRYICLYATTYIDKKSFISCNFENLLLL